MVESMDSVYDSGVQSFSNHGSLEKKFFFLN